MELSPVVLNGSEESLCTKANKNKVKVFFLDDMKFFKKCHIKYLIWSPQNINIHHNRELEAVSKY